MGLATIVTILVAIIILYIFCYFLWGCVTLIKVATDSQDIMPGFIPPPVAEVIVKVFFYIFVAALFIFGLLLMFLIIIFILWMIIRFIVPAWILFIPVRDILLAIPPFPEFTDAGILPLMERLSNVVGGGDSFLRKIVITSRAVIDFLNKATKFIFQKIFPGYDPDKLMKVSGINFNDDTKGNPKYESRRSAQDDEDQNKKDNMSPLLKRTMDLIDIEKKSCVNKNIKEITPNLGTAETLSLHSDNMKVSIQCEADAMAGMLRANVLEMTMSNAS